MLKIVKDSVLRVSRSLGYDIVPLREMKERDFALHLRELLARLEIDCVLDVGANVGQYHDFLRNKVLYDGTIVSFEPVSRHVELLRERARADGDWHVEGYALGAQDGSLPINIMASDQFSSFPEPDNSRVRDYAELNVPCHVETVTVRTLDVVLPVLQERLGFDRPYLKLDTQGFDIEVLQGGRDSLGAVRAFADRGIGDRHLQGHAGLRRHHPLSRRARLRHHRPLSGESRQFAEAGRVRLRNDQPLGGVTSSSIVHSRAMSSSATNMLVGTALSRWRM
jgi:FkbM family methyltransferase